MSTDEELMAAYVQGDAAAFGELFRRYAPVLLRVLGRQLRSREEAHDLVQQTFLQLHRARNDFRAGAALRPWLFTIALNLQREHFRRRGRRPETPLELDGRRDPAEGPRGVERLDAARDLLAALDRIHTDQREVIELHWFEGLSFPEIAELVGATVTAVKVRAHRGYTALRRLLGEGGATDPSGNQGGGPGIPNGGNRGLR
jgi:RNA polymerase sigma factor (sigma-70 family)